MSITIRLNKGPIQIEWQLKSFKQANTEVFGKICEEMARISAYLKQLEWERQNLLKWQRDQINSYHRVRKRYGPKSLYWRNRAIRSLRTLFEEKVKP